MHAKLRTAIGLYMFAAAGLVTILLARSVSESIGGELESLIHWIGSLHPTLTLLLLGVLTVLVFPGAFLVILYELEEVYLAWAVQPGDETPRLALAHQLRNLLER